MAMPSSHIVASERAQVPKLSDTPAIIKQISQARKAFDAILRTKKEIRRNFYQAIGAELTSL
jgi:hypothetical protein